MEMVTKGLFICKNYLERQAVQRIQPESASCRDTREAKFPQIFRVLSESVLGIFTLKQAKSLIVFLESIANVPPSRRKITVWV